MIKLYRFGLPISYLCLTSHYFIETIIISCVLSLANVTLRLHHPQVISQPQLVDARAKKQAMDETEYIMSSPAMVEILRQEDEDIKNGRGRVVTLDEIWK